MVSGTRIPGIKFRLLFSHCMTLESQIISLCLSFLICKVALIIASTSQEWWEKALRIDLAHNKCLVHFVYHYDTNSLEPGHDSMYSLRHFYNCSFSFEDCLKDKFSEKDILNFNIKVSLPILSQCCHPQITLCTLLHRWKLTLKEIIRGGNVLFSQ